MTTKRSWWLVKEPEDESQYEKARKRREKGQLDDALQHTLDEDDVTFAVVMDIMDTVNDK